MDRVRLAARDQTVLSCAHCDQQNSDDSDEEEAVVKADDDEERKKNLLEKKRRLKERFNAEYDDKDATYFDDLKEEMEKQAQVDALTASLYDAL